MRYLPFTVIMLTLFINIASASPDQCASFYKGQAETKGLVDILAEDIVALAKSSNLPVTSIITSPGIQARIRPLKSSIAGIDGILKAKIKDIQNRPEPVVVKEEEPAPRPRVPQKRIERVSVDSLYYEVAQNISHMFRQNPDNIHPMSGGRMITDTRYEISEILHILADGTISPTTHLNKNPGQVYSNFTELQNGNIAFLHKYNTGSAIVFLIPNSNNVLPQLNLPINFSSEMIALPNGKLLIGDNKGKVFVITPPTSPHHPGSYKEFTTSTGDMPTGFAVLPNGDLVISDYNQFGRGLNYHRWDNRLQTFVHSYQFPTSSMSHTKNIASIERLKDGRLVTTGYDGKIVIWKADPVTNRYDVEDAHYIGGFIWNARELPNGNLIVNTNQNKLYMMVKDPSGKFIPHQQPHTMGVIGRSLVVLPNGNFITMGDPTNIGYQQAGYSSQVKEVFVWKPKKDVLEVEVDVED